MTVWLCNRRKNILVLVGYSTFPVQIYQNVYEVNNSVYKCGIQWWHWYILRTIKRTIIRNGDIRFNSIKLSWKKDNLSLRNGKCVEIIIVMHKVHLYLKFEFGKTHVNFFSLFIKYHDRTHTCVVTVFCVGSFIDGFPSISVIWELFQTLLWSEFWGKIVIF